eukprot:SAG31_NODE_42028_length_273_cov_0.890805_1_plen_21_part_01
MVFLSRVNNFARWNRLPSNGG